MNHKQTQPTKILHVYQLGQQNYQPIWQLQKYLQQQRQRQLIPDTLLLLEHPPIYTIGKSGNPQHYIAPKLHSQPELAKIPLLQVDRGGDITYHGPGQLIGYPIFDLRQHKKSVCWYMRALEETLIQTLQKLGIPATRKEKLTGVWVNDEKIAALGARISRWITMHGFALNVQPNLQHFQGIIPCGIPNKGITSLQKLLPQLPHPSTLQKLLLESFQTVFHFHHTQLKLPEELPYEPLPQP